MCGLQKRIIIRYRCLIRSVVCRSSSRVRCRSIDRAKCSRSSGRGHVWRAYAQVIAIDADACGLRGRREQNVARARCDAGSAAQVRVRRLFEQRRGAVCATGERARNRLERRAPNGRFRRADGFVETGTVRARRASGHGERAEGRETTIDRTDRSAPNDQ